MSDALLWNEMGNIYLKIGSLEEAIVAYTRAIEFDPDNGWPYCNLGHIHFLKGEHGQALFLFRKSIQLMGAPADQAVVWNKIGDAYRALKDIDNAIQAYKKASDLDTAAAPLEKKADGQPGTLTKFREMTKTEKIAPDTGSAPSALPKPTAPGGLPSDIQALAEIQALADGFQPINGEKDSRENRLPRDFPKTKSPVSPKPIKVEEKPPIAPLAAPSSPGRDDLEEILAKVNIYENITHVNPTNDRAWDTLGKLYKSLGRYQDAIGSYHKAIEMAPHREVYYYYLGLLYSVEQQHDEAIRAFQLVLQKNPDYVLAHSALAGVYHRMGLETKANHHIATALPKMNNESAYNRACFYAICGDTELAFEFLRLALKNKDTTIEWIKSDPDLDPIRTDQRYQELISETDRPAPETTNENYFSSELEGNHNRLLPILNHSLAR